MVALLARVETPTDSNQMELLSSLAREMVLVAAAAQEGCRAHVVGRTHLKCAAVTIHNGRYPKPTQGFITDPSYMDGCLEEPSQVAVYAANRGVCVRVSDYSALSAKTSKRKYMYSLPGVIIQQSMHAPTSADVHLLAVQGSP